MHIYEMRRIKLKPKSCFERRGTLVATRRASEPLIADMNITRNRSHIHFSLKYSCTSSRFATSVVESWFSSVAPAAWNPLFFPLPSLMPLPHPLAALTLNAVKLRPYPFNVPSSHCLRSICWDIRFLCSWNSSSRILCLSACVYLTCS